MDVIHEVTSREEKMPYVTFGREVVEDHAKSREQGRYIGKDVDYVYITPAYTKDILPRPVHEWFEKLEGDIRNQRIPPGWLTRYKEHYEAWKNGQELPLEGTPIKGWGVISPAMQETLVKMSIRTVEDLAGVNEDGLRRIGMGSVDLKNKAKAWLAQLGDKGPLTQEIAADKARIRELEGSVATLAEQVRALMAGTKVEREPEAGISVSDLLEPTDEELSAKYKAIHGRNPHPAMKREKLIEAVK